MSEEFPEAEVARYWNRNADAWAREVRRGRDIARERLNNPAFLEFIGDLSGEDVLDAGCEPRASEEYCREHPSQRGWRDHAPLYLYFRAVKPDERGP